MQTQAPVAEHQAEDFFVREAKVVDLATRTAATVEYRLLHKHGYTTEAAGLVAERFGIACEYVTYCGLKDDEGITEQLVALPIEVTRTGPDAWWHEGEQGRWLFFVQQHGYGHHPLRVGDLQGNAFQIFVRNLSDAQATGLSEQLRFRALILNYYDTQRFGVHTRPKRAHEVGEALLRGSWKNALRVLRELGAPESRQAAKWRGFPEAFLRAVENRISSFCLASYASYQWNERLRALIHELRLPSAHNVKVDSVPYTNLPSAADVAKVLTTAQTLPYTRYSVGAGGVEERQSLRATVLQTLVTASDPHLHEAHPGRSRITFTFFLPSVARATALVRQVVRWS